MNHSNNFQCGFWSERLITLVPLLKCPIVTHQQQVFCRHDCKNVPAFYIFVIPVAPFLYFLILAMLVIVCVCCPCHKITILFCCRDGQRLHTENNLQKILAGAIRTVGNLRKKNGRKVKVTMLLFLHTSFHRIWRQMRNCLCARRQAIKLSNHQQPGKVQSKI